MSIYMLYLGRGSVCPALTLGEGLGQRQRIWVPGATTEVLAVPKGHHPKEVVPRPRRSGAKLYPELGIVGVSELIRRLGKSVQGVGDDAELV